MASPAPLRPAVIIRQHPVKTNATSAGSGKERISAQTAATGRQAPPRLKMLIRRLPPGLTLEEFVNALGEEWAAGGSRVDWLAYKEGKVSKDASKPSRPGRAYLHLTKADFLTPLSNCVQHLAFSDLKNTVSDSCLLGPPSLEFAPYGRIPAFKPRRDARQGTIDQDSEFIDFLQDLTNPVVKPAPLESTPEKDPTGSADTVTPLVQFLRDKKANKNKDNVPAKTGKHTRQDTKDAKPRSNEKGAKVKEAKETLSAVSEKKTPNISKNEKSGRDHHKTSNKPMPSASLKATQLPSATQTLKGQLKSQENTQPPPIPAERKRNKVGAEAKSLLQRDLGLGTGGRRRRGEAVTTPNQNPKPLEAATESKTVPSSGVQNGAAKGSGDRKSKPNALAAVPPESATGDSSAKALPAQVPTGPAASRNPARSDVSSSAKSTKVQSDSTNMRIVSSTQAFLKHANPSQGITEPLLRDALTLFGGIETVEIDKKKGFAYAEFSEPEGLRKAIAASPVKVAQGQVMVLERKEGKVSSPRSRSSRSGGRGRSGGGRGGTAGRAEKQVLTQTTTSAAASSDSKT